MQDSPPSSKHSIFSPTKTIQKSVEKQSGRISTIDYLKGFAMFAIIFVHLGAYWNDNSWESLWRIIWLFLDWLGPSIFISITVIGTMISIKRKELAGKNKGMGLNALKKFSYLFIVGEIMNYIIDMMNPKQLGPWQILGMNMITAVAYAQLLVYAFIKLSQRQRFILLVILIMGFPVLFDYCVQGLNYDFNIMINLGMDDLTTVPAILYYLLFYIQAMIPTYSWLILMLATMIVFNGFIDFKVKTTMVAAYHPNALLKLKQWHAYHVNRLFWLGFILVTLTIIMGGYALVDKSFAGTYIGLWNDDPFHIWNLPGIPLFLSQ